MELFNNDCLTIMPTLAAESIDCIICDLPYGRSRNKWDIVIPFVPLWLEYNRLIKDNGAIILFGNQPFTSELISSNRTMFRYCLIWAKNNPSDFFNSKKKPLNAHEDIVVFYKRQPTFNPQYTQGKPYKYTSGKQSTNYVNTYTSVTTINNGQRCPTTVLHFPKVRETKITHPTEKPVPLLEWLIKTYTNENDTVLDNCMGTGATGKACANLNRQFIGIELDKQYFEIAIERLK